MKAGRVRKGKGKLTQQALQRLIGIRTALVVVVVMVFLVVAYWDPLTKPVENPSGVFRIIGVRPIVGALKIGILFGIVFVICASLGSLISGRLIKKLSGHGIEFAEPSNEALATESLDKRVTELEETQKKTLEAHKKQAQEDQE
jgi:hypothetical protein